MLSQIKSFGPYLLSVLRIVSALVLFSIGTQKILEFPASTTVLSPFSLPWIADFSNCFSASSS